jgi:kynurenine 3-monooxygenase
MRKIIVLGAGLVGSVLSSILARHGCRVEVYDHMADIRETHLTSGRSINLTLCERGLNVLDRLGVGEAVRRISVPVYGRLVHDVSGSLSFQPYGNRQEAIYSVARGDLNRVLLDFAARHFDIEFHFNERCLEVDLETPAVVLKNLKTGEVTRRTAEMIFGADGAYSTARLRMQKKTRFNFSQQYWEQGYKELSVPLSADSWAAEKNVIHIWPRGNYMLIGFPNTDGSFTCSLHIPFEGPLSFESIKTEADLLALFENSFPDAIPHMPNLAEEFFSRPVNSMVTIKCSPWSYRDKAALIGDAAHTIYPSYGQGANAGFEDCAVLDECMDRYGEDWTALLKDFERQRKPNTDAIADLCVEHFVELRDLVGTPEFLRRKEIERRINRMYPDEYRDLYSMITFTRMPYTEALRTEREQYALVEQLMRVEDIEHKLNSGEVDHLIDGLMAARR